MIFQGIDVSGSFDITGSFVAPKGAAFPLTASSTQGDVFFHTSLDTMYVFTDSGSWTPIGDITSSTPPPPADLTPNIEYLVVAGGGGSAYDGGGGGGAGGFLSSSIDDVASGSVMTITVGAGGNVASNGTNSSLASTSGTSFTTVTSTGGGTGAGAGNSYTAGDGGSGGGGAGGQYNNPGGSGIVGQGNDGGTSGTSGGGTTYPGSGGGGAGAVGGAGVNSGGAGKPGGIGKQSTITGTATYYAGGGGGASGGGGGGAGGSGGGGAGGNSAQGTAGTANTGGGAGGSNVTAGVTGGSGVVILAYPTSSATGQGGVKTTRSDGHFVHQFNESGTFTLGGADFHTIAPTENFNILTWTGNATARSISTGFAPDLVWIKARNFASNNSLYDSVRTAPYYLASNANSAQSNATTSLTSFDSNGFSLGDDSGQWGVNASGKTYVGWCWKAGGAAVSNTNGTITSSVSANQAAGFSIVKYTATGTTATVGHGLSSAPELILSKTTSAAYDWLVYAAPVGATKQMRLHATTGANTSGFMNNTAPTDSVYTVASGNNLNYANGDVNVAYCFTSIPGYQKIGSYTGTSGDITVTTGFRPKFVMVKRTNSTGHWEMHDSVRFSTIKDENGASSRLRANDAGTEGAFNNSPIFFTETGFTLDSSVSANSYGDYDANGSTYLYLAISE